MKRVRITPVQLLSHAAYDAKAYDRNRNVLNTMHYGSWSTPSSGFSWIADEKPHRWDSLTTCEHMKLRHEPSLPVYPISRAADYESKAVASAQYPRTYEPDTYGIWSQSARGPIATLPRGPSDTPWWPNIAGSLQVSNAISGLKSRVSRLGLGRAGLAESIGELPETPRLFQAVSLSKGLVANTSSAYLNATFGWRPILDLIEPIRDELHRYRAGLRASRRQCTGRRTLFFSTPIIGSDPFSYHNEIGSRWPEFPDTMLDEFCERLSERTNVGYLALVDIKRKRGTPPIADYIGSVDGLINLRTYWELIPNSFLVDYFVGLGDYISRIQGNLLYDIKVQAEAWSIRHKSAYQTGFRQGGVFHLHTADEIEYYYRSTQLPVLSCLPELKWPTAKVLPTLVALSAQRYSSYLDKLLTTKSVGSSLVKIARSAPWFLPHGGIMKQRANVRYYLPRR